MVLNIRSVIIWRHWVLKGQWQAHKTSFLHFWFRPQFLHSSPSELLYLKTVISSVVNFHHSELISNGAGWCRLSKIAYALSAGCTWYISQCIVLVSHNMSLHYNLFPLWRYITDASVWNLAEPSNKTISRMSCEVVNPFNSTLFLIVAKMMIPKCSAPYWSNPPF